MFRRLILDDSAAFFTLAAFITAGSIYVAIAWRALRMRRSELEHFANLPFTTATPAADAAGVASGGLPKPKDHGK